MDCRIFRGDPEVVFDQLQAFLKGMEEPPLFVTQSEWCGRFIAVTVIYREWI